MDFWGAMRVLRRRWYIALPSAVLAIGLSAAVFLSIDTRYQSNGVMLLTTPAAGSSYSQKTSPEDAVRINPLLAFDGSLSTTSQIIAQVLADPKTREQLGVKEGSPDSFTATGGGQNGPFLFVLGESDTPQRAEQMVATVLDHARKELDDRQRGLSAPESTFITSQVIVNPTKAEAQIGGKIRYAGAALVLLLLITTASTFAADSIMQNLKRRKAAKETADSEPTAEPEPEPAPAPTPVPAPEASQPAPVNGFAPRPVPSRPPRTASEKTVKIAVPQNGPSWPTREDTH
jgi:hypothetical protein